MALQIEWLQEILKEKQTSKRNFAAVVYSISFLKKALEFSMPLMLLAIPDQWFCLQARL